jgi:hypothetical protein
MLHCNSAVWLQFDSERVAQNYQIFWLREPRGKVTLLREQLRYLLSLHRDGQRAFAQKASPSSQFPVRQSRNSRHALASGK